MSVCTVTRNFYGRARERTGIPLEKGAADEMAFLSLENIRKERDRCARAC